MCLLPLSIFNDKLQTFLQKNHEKIIYLYNKVLPKKLLDNVFSKKITKNSHF